MKMFVSILVLVSTPILAVVGLVTFIRLFMETTLRAVVTDALVCIACWGLGSFVFGWFGQLAAGDNAQRAERIAAGAFYGGTCFVLGTALIAGVAVFRYRQLSQRQQLITDIAKE